MRWRRDIAASIGVVLLSGLAVAADGEIEINHVRALAGAITGSLADDPPGYPVRITQPGSYRLTSDLDLSSVQISGISIAAISDVTIDLSGFTIRGLSGVHVTPPVWQCLAGAVEVSGHAGVRAEPDLSGTTRNITVRNGRILQIGGHGIDFGTASGVRIERMDVERNCGDGIRVGHSAAIASSRSRANRLNGIRCADRCRVLDSAAEENWDAGISTSGRSLLRGVLVRGNGGSGILPGAASRVEASVSVANGVIGGPGHSGVLASAGSLVTTTIVNRNQGYGIAASTEAGIGHTVQDQNTATSTAGRIVGCILREGSRSCPSPP